MARRRVYEGKAKILYEGTEPGTFIQHFKDGVTAFNNRKQSTFEGKGVLNNLICEFLYTRLASIGIPTHLIRSLNMREQLIHAVDIVPLEVVVRNAAAGSLVKRLGLQEGVRLSRPLVEFFYKDDKLGDPLVSEEHITTLGWCSEADLEEITSMTLRINDILSGLFCAVGLALVDIKLEFGRLYEHDEARIVLADEISPDVCRLRDISTSEIFDKDVFRTGKGDLLKAYREVANRLGIGGKDIRREVSDREEA